MRVLKYFLLAATALTLTSCQQTSSRKTASESPQSVMVRVARQVQTCWFQKNDPAFSEFGMVTELNSHVGRPRILITPKGKPTGLPRLVIQAERSVGVTGVATFGPLLDSKDGARIQDSISKWAGGGKSC